MTCGRALTLSGGRRVQVQSAPARSTWGRSARRRFSPRGRRTRAGARDRGGVRHHLAAASAVDQPGQRARAWRFPAGRPFRACRRRASRRNICCNASQKIFGQYDRLMSQTVVMPHPEAAAALVAAGGPITGYFSSAPYTQIALAEGRVHKVLTSADVIGGKSSFLIMGATRGSSTRCESRRSGRRRHDRGRAHRPGRSAPRRAIYLAPNLQGRSDERRGRSAAGRDQGRFGSAVYSARRSPLSWDDTASSRRRRAAGEIVAPALLNLPSRYALSDGGPYGRHDDSTSSAFAAACAKAPTTAW